MKQHKSIFSLSHQAARRILASCCSLSIIMMILSSGLMGGYLGGIASLTKLVSEGVPYRPLTDIDKLFTLIIIVGSFMLAVLIAVIIRLFFYNQDDMKRRYAEAIAAFAIFLILPFTLIIPAQIALPFASWEILIRVASFLMTRTLPLKIMTVTIIAALVISILMYRRVMGLGGEIAVLGLEDEFASPAPQSRNVSSTNLREQAISVTLIRDSDQKSFSANSRGYVVVGRKPKKHALTISDDSALSGNHCQIRLSNSTGYKIRDLGSQNGTSVNGQKIGSTSVALKNGSKLRLGRHNYTVRL